jgi:proteic killer suppression protein
LIRSFADAATEDLFHGHASARKWRFPAEIRRTALRKLDMIDAARELRDLASPPGNRLELLSGSLAGLHSIRVNDQWRIVFRWGGIDAFEVKLTDYHG